MNVDLFAHQRHWIYHIMWSANGGEPYDLELILRSSRSFWRFWICDGVFSIYLHIRYKRYQASVSLSTAVSTLRFNIRSRSLADRFDDQKKRVIAKMFNLDMIYFIFDERTNRSVNETGLTKKQENWKKKSHIQRVEPSFAAPGRLFQRL